MPPITPEAAKAAKEGQIPDIVFDAFNRCITKHLDEGESEFTVNEVVAVIVSLGLNREDIFTNKWLDVEDIYRGAGWNVIFDKPGFNESYDAYFRFTKSLRRTKKKGS
jgi:hypothetical protein